LGFNLDCSRWLHRQLKNCSFLTFSHTVQERDLTVWKFQRIMMRHGGNVRFVPILLQKTVEGFLGQ
jgi:hypothetical protein